MAAAPQRGANPSFATGERGLIPVRKLSCALLMGNKAHPYKLGVTLSARLCRFLSPFHYESGPLVRLRSTAEKEFSINFDKF